MDGPGPEILDRIMGAGGGKFLLVEVNFTSVGVSLFKDILHIQNGEKRVRKKDVKVEVSTVIKEYFWDVRK